MKYLIFAMSLMALTSCKDNKKQESNTEINSIEEPVIVKEKIHNDEVSNVYKNAWTEEIAMDHGNKWQADAVTTEGVEKMKMTLKAQSTSTLDAYHKLAKMLNEDKNNVIKNCTMKGDSHDNLHIWLLPLIEKIAALSETTTIEDASKIRYSIEENINGYHTYFQ
jgi:hypothetical protein